MFTIRSVEQDDQKPWDEYVLSHLDSSPYHLWAWKEAVEQVYGHQTYYLLAEDHSQLVGVLPLVNLRVPFLLNELTALPFCDLGNCLADSLQIQVALVDKAREIAETIKSKAISLRGQLKDFSCSGLYVENTGKVRMILSLPESSESLLASFKSKLRSQVRKAEKNGVEFHWTGLDGVDSYYSVYSQNMRDLGSPAHSKQWFRAIMTHYGDRARIGLAEFEGKCIGAGLILSTNSQTTIPWASTLREHNRLAPNMLLYWNCLKLAADSGKQSFDFGRSTEGEGTYRFKKQWGAQPEPLIWYSSFSSKTEKDSSHGGSREKVEKIWQKMPLPIANIIGPVLRKYISL